MKKYRKFFSFITILLMIMSLCTPIIAQEKKELSINFSEFQFITDDYNAEEVHVKYEKSGMKEIAYIIDNNGNILETMSVLASGNRVKDVYPYIFTRSVRYGKTVVEFNMNVELYSHGSFRQINAYKGGYVGIATSITKTRLEGSNHNAWSPSGFPTIELYYAFNGTIVATVYSSTGASIIAQLKKAGFSASYTQGNETYYRRSFNSDGIIKLYN